MALDALCALYGADNEPWLAALLTACAGGSQSGVARQLGFSPTLVNLLVHGNYTKDLTAVEERVRRVLMGPLECPVMGPISDEDCRSNQALPFSNGNHQRIALYRACRRGCSHSTLKAGAK